MYARSTETGSPLLISMYAYAKGFHLVLRIGSLKSTTTILKPCASRMPAVFDSSSPLGSEHTMLSSVPQALSMVSIIRRLVFPDPGDPTIRQCFSDTSIVRSLVSELSNMIPQCGLVSNRLPQDMTPSGRSFFIFAMPPYW